MCPRALVVEDDPRARKVLCDIVAGEKFEVDAVADGELALQALKRHSYEVIILDIVLPRMSGTALLEHLHTSAPEMLKSVIVVTGLEVGEIRKLYPDVHAALGKPVLPARLRKLIRTLGHGHDEAKGIIVA